MLREQIIQYLELLNDRLASLNVKGEICLYGGAVMSLVFNARPATKDVDAVFEPTKTIRDAIKQVTLENHLDPDWLNDGVKGFLVPHGKKVLFHWSNLDIYYADPDYLLAMKTISARIDATDRGDIEFLIKKLDISTPEQVFAVVEKYYPKNRIKPAAQFFIEEIFDQ